MIGKKINQLATELAPVSTDLTIIGDPVSGVSKKITLAQLGAIFSGAVSFYTNLAAFPVVGDINVIYCAKDTQKLYLWSGSAYTEVFPSQALLDTYQLRSEKGVSNGYASLDSGGKVPISQLPSSIMEYKGTWNAATNTPTLANGTGDTGDVYICNVAGTVNFGAGPLTFAVGDYVIYSGTIWQRSSGAVGTVTSVAVSRSGDALAITGSPITTSGTINLGFAGNSTQYINGAGNLVTFPGIINEAQNLITEVYNKTGATLTKGTVVYINGGQGNLPAVTKALATGDSTSAQTYGIVRNDITNNNNGYVVVVGRIGDLDTQAYTEGTQLYLSPTTAGTYTSTKPYAPQHLVYVGIVVRAHPTQGVIEVKIQNGYEMDELHNVAAQSPDNNDILQYKTATSLWTKVAGTTTNIAEGTNLYYTEARVNANTNVAANTAARHNAVTLGTANGLSLSTQVLSLALASGSTTGALSSTDWNTFNNKQAAGNYVTTDTFQTITANKKFSVGLTLGSAGGTNQDSTFANTNSIHSGSGGSNIFGFNNSNNIYFGKGLSNGGVITFNNSSVRFYALPDADGTIALVGGAGVGTVTSVGLSSATSGVTIGSTPITTSGTITLAIATASGSQQGLLSSTDWTTFNNKQNALTNPVTGTGTTNYLPKFTGTSTIGNSQIFDNGTNVGIGTATPSYKLEIYNAAGASAVIGAATGKIYVYGDDAGGTVGTLSSIPLRFATNGTERMRLDASGNLGLGVTPSAWGSGYTALQIENTGLMADADRIWMYANGYFDGSANRYIQNGFASRYYQANSSHVWETAPSGTAGNAISFTQAMTLDASGRLGIGVTSPTAILDINSGANSPIIRLTSSAAGQIPFSIRANIPGFSNSGFSIYDETAAASRLVISSTGNVGIGTTSPLSGVGFGLQITAPIGQAAYSRVNYTGYTGLDVIQGGDGTGYLYLRDNNDLRIATNNTERLRITSGGNVGIGTTSPSAVLEVAGTSANTDFRISRTVSASTYFYISAPGGTPSTATLGVNGTSCLQLNSTGAATFSSTIQTAAPTNGTAQPWKLGNAVSGGVTTNHYIIVEINGTTYTINALNGLP